MALWSAHYQDKQHDLDCFIENHYKEDLADPSLKMYIDGVIFWSCELDDWELL